ncbi:class I adenylate-forming enzyme family protein [Pollutimonas bauzanensis]|uniref:Acyl-CoA synthetase (AMP-forming)/AMP-acid ligase II n=1 Tax=Pollutimonas bauzanensis TaxID=658167 RepID=A0A1M5Q8D5_9BURK|nr:class I adenylate-forming enzyme family protein [Pollutimonas bauzanensis]SHH10190.1 Acyl-CoA synthetase (AMP-forming)/AMP-acid ligase II [Pollutimonas bauzanensis]
MRKEETSLPGAYPSLWRSEAWAPRPALTDAKGETTLSYGALYERVSGMAGRLRHAGVKPRQLVALSMERSIDNVLALLGLMAAGACPCPLEPRLAPAEIHDRLQAVGAGTVLVDAANEAVVAPASGLRVLRADTLPAAQAYWSEEIQPEDPGLLLFTSGSTGRPKGVLLSHRGLLNNARGVIPLTELNQFDKLLHVMPLYHTNGLNNQLFSPLLVGAHVVLADRFRATDMPRLMDFHRPTIITGVPTMYSRMLELSFTPESLAALRFARCGSAPITQELHVKIEALLQRPLIVSYGLSEATCTSTMNPPGQRKIGSIGKALPFQNIYLCASDGSTIREPGIDGEICIEGENLMLGYLGTQGDGVLEPPDMVLRTGDLGRMDEAGYFYITGRIKDVIIRGGENISPAIIEQAISASPEVRSCCVLGRPDPDLGEVPVAFVVPADSARCDKAAIQALVRERLSRIHHLEDVFFVDALPENSVGKIDRKALAKSLPASY